MKKPELVAPAGDLEKLKVAIMYGADAVYMGGELFSLRANAKNFNKESMREGIAFAHDMGAKAYIAVNIFARDSDLDGVKAYFRSIKDMGMDAVIISDPGVFSIAREVIPNTRIHISTQANVTNYKTADFWHQAGASRVVLARELTRDDIKNLRDSLTDEMGIEIFAHGAMCMSYSGRCLLSAGMSGRDANRGNCSHPCRWKYAIAEASSPGEYYPVEEDDMGTYILNSKDLCLIGHVPEIFETGADSIKIEGRMKSVFYVGTIVKAYREAIDTYFDDAEIYRKNVQYYVDEVSKVSHRQYSTGFFIGGTHEDMQVYDSGAYINKYDFVGIVMRYDEANGYAIVEQRNNFRVGDELELLRIKGSNEAFIVEEMLDEDNRPITVAAHAQQVIKIKANILMQPYEMLRRAKK